MICIRPDIYAGFVLRILTRDEIILQHTHFIPRVARRRKRKDQTQYVVNCCGNNNPRQVVEVVNVLSAYWNSIAALGSLDGANKTNDVDEDSGNVRGKAAPGEPEGVVVGCVLFWAVQAPQVQVALADNIVVTKYDPGNGGEENGVSGKVGGEIVRRRHKFPLRIDLLALHFRAKSSQRV